MTSTLTHKGYIAHLTLDADAGVIHGQVVNTRDVLTFSAKSAADLKKEFADTIADYEDWCDTLGQQPQKPLSGTISLRMGAELHQAAATRAAALKVSLNAWIVSALERELGRRPAVLTAHEVDNRVATRVRQAFQNFAQRADPDEASWQAVEPRPRERRAFQ